MIRVLLDASKSSRLGHTSRAFYCVFGVGDVAVAILGGNDDVRSGCEGEPRVPHPDRSTSGCGASGSPFRNYTRNLLALDNVRSTLEIELDAELEEPRLSDRQRVEIQV